MKSLSHLNRFRERIPQVDDQYRDEHRGLIRDKVCYIDLLKFRLPNKYHGIDLSTLETCCLGQMDIDNGPIEYFDKKTGKTRENRKWRQHITLHQPTVAAIALLDQWAKETGLPYAIAKLEVALDFVTDSEDHARKLHNFLNHHFIMKWHGTHELLFYHDTTYFVQKRYGKQPVRSYAIYSSRPSKPVDLPCCHLEVRFFSSKAIRTFQLSGFSSILNLDVNAFWRTHLNLRSINAKSLLRKIELREGKEWAHETRGRFPQTHPIGREEYIAMKAECFWNACTNFRAERGDACVETYDAFMGMTGISRDYICKGSRNLTFLPAQVLADYGREYGYGGSEHLRVIAVDEFLPACLHRNL